VAPSSDTKVVGSVDRERWQARRAIVGSLAAASGQGSLDELRAS
jgi:hypothetical protein